MPKSQLACLGIAGAMLATILLLVACASRAASGAEPTPAANSGDAGMDSRLPARRSPADRRLFTARNLQTIFSPLDLPTPTLARAADGSPGPEYWRQQADYVIEAVLDDERRELTGRATITYTNNSPQALDFIWLHLEQNVFREDSLGTLTSLDSARFTNGSDFDSGSTLEYVRTRAGDLKFTVYDTVARVDLLDPIPARARGEDTGGRIVLEVAWSFRVPRHGMDRMGIDDAEQGPIFQIAQWFPAVAAYDDVYGWNTLPYLGQGEFYTDFGNYDVRITVPLSHIVAATGMLQNEEEVLTRVQIERLGQARQSETTVLIRTPEEVGDPASRPGEGDAALTWHFIAENVRTFAFASSASFIWDAAWLAQSGGAAGGTLVQSVYPKEALPLWSQSTEMLRFAIKGYNERWFAYPYPVAMNVNGSVGGMEYPMIIFCAERSDERGLYGVTTHEIGHNWFPMLVNTDERRHAWMDEGVNSFINIYSMLERYPDWKEADNTRDFAGALLPPGNAPMETRPDLLGPGLLGMLEYGKTAVALYLLREYVMGPERFDAAFRAYIRRWAFKSPRPADFFRTMEDVAGMDLAWFWRGWILETGGLDQSVEGVAQRSDNETASVVLGNLGEMVMPVTVRLTYDDGSTTIERLPVEIWHWTDRWTADFRTSGKRVVKAEVDPERILPDGNPRNNWWEAPPSTEPHAPGRGAQRATGSTAPRE